MLRNTNWHSPLAGKIGMIENQVSGMKKEMKIRG